MPRAVCQVQGVRIFVCFVVLVAALPAAIFIASPIAHAVQASPWPIETKQPDGTSITLHVRGDEYLHWHEDTSGYAVVEDAGWYRYADSVVNGELRASAHAVGKVSPSAVGLTQGLKPAPLAIRARGIGSVGAQVAGAAPESRGDPLGTIKNIVILMRFSNHVSRPLPSNADMNILFNAVGGHATLAPTGSVRDVYFENSYGLMTLDSTVFGWVNLPQTEQYYANNNSGLDTTIHQAIVAALNAVDPQINFSQFDQDSDGFVDAIAFVHSGYAAEFGGTDAYGAASSQRIWSHRWSISTWTSAEGVRVSPYHINPGVWSTSGSSIGRVGVIAHETGHFFGLPDLYDTQGSGEGIGSWGLMANSWGFNGTQYNPPHFSSWSKIRLGWVTPTVLTAPGSYNLPQWATSPTVYQVNRNYPSGEYLLIENRQPAGIEAAIPQGGLVVFHIDEATGHNNEGYPGQPGWPENGNHYQVAVLQADGLYELERGFNRGNAGDTYHAGGVSALTPLSVPNTNAYQGGEILFTSNSLLNVGPAAPTMNFTLDFGDPLFLQSGEATWWQFNTSGPEGGPFSPSSKPYLLTNTSQSTPVTVNITSFEPWLDVSTPGTTLAAGGATLASLNVAPEASLLPVGEYEATATFQNAGTGYSYEIDARLNIANVIASFPLNTDPGWARTGQWQFGTPTGQAGDPTSGKTGSFVFGYNLNGAYPNNLGLQTLTTNAINCSNYSTVVLRFWRWLGIEAFALDNASVMVSTDGVNFQSVWFHTGGSFQDNAWVEQVFDITSIAAGQSTVYVRWIMGTTDSSVTFGGWNIDDISLMGTPNNSQTIISYNLATNPGWTTEGNWEWGMPVGLAGDPLLGHGDLNAYGYNLSGPYENSMPPRRLTSTPINCSNYTNVRLRFWRWLAIEDSVFDEARVQVSNNGVNFTDVWVHDGPTLIDTQWTLQNIDISSIADGQSTVYLRWVMGATDGSVVYGGWNIDDVSLVGVTGGPSSVVWVDFAHAGAQFGTQALPYRSAIAGVVKAQAEQTVLFKGNSSDTVSSETITIRKPLRLESTGGVVRIGVN